MQDHTKSRKQRRASSSAVKQTSEALALAHCLLDRGDIARATRAIQLAERQAKLAERLIDLKASLKRIAEAKRQAEQHFAQREAGLRDREAIVKAREIALPPLKPWNPTRQD